MSTKATKELAEAVRDGVPVVASMGVDALAEIAALEQAVVDLWSHGYLDAARVEGLSAASATLMAIAKEANAHRPPSETAIKCLRCSFIARSLGEAESHAKFHEGDNR